MSNLKQTFRDICDAYLKSFCTKHGIDYEKCYWIGGHVGEVVDCDAVYSVSLDDIRVDIDQAVDVEVFEAWYEYCLRLGMIGVGSMPNYRSWVAGCPRKTEYEIVNLEHLHAEVEKAKAILNDAINREK